MKVNKISAFIGILLLLIAIYDIIFYWPDDSELPVFIAKKVINIVFGYYLVWFNLIKPIYTKTIIAQ